MSLDNATPKEWDEATRRFAEAGWLENSSPTEYVDPYDAAAGQYDTPPTDLVNRPPHYNKGEIECIKYIEDSLGPLGFSFYCEGNAKKYLHRWRYKDQIRDLEKLQYFITELIRVAKTIQL